MACLVAFFVLLGAHLILREMRDSFITDNHIYDYYRSMFSEERVKELLSERDTMRWSFFVFKPTEIAISTILLLTIFIAGFFLMDKKVPFVSLINVVLISQLVLYIPFFIQNFWFMNKTGFTIEEFSAFSWHSVYDLFPTESVPKYLKYAFRKLSVFQLIFIAVLALGFQKHLQMSYWKSLGTIAVIYVPGLKLRCQRN